MLGQKYGMVPTAATLSQFERQGDGRARCAAAGDGLGPFHILDAVVEGGPCDGLRAPNRVGELLLNAPAPLLLRRNGDLGQCCVAAPATIEPVVRKAQRPLAPE